MSDFFLSCGRWPGRTKGGPEGPGHCASLWSFLDGWHVWWKPKWVNNSFQSWPLGLVSSFWLCKHRDTTEREHESMFSPSRCFIHSIYLSPHRWRYCCDDCNCDLCWTVGVGYHHIHNMFLQPQKVRSLTSLKQESWDGFFLLFLEPFCFLFAGWRGVSGLLFQIRLIAASRDGHQNQHRCGNLNIHH